MMDSDVIDIQMKLAYLEQLIDTLNDVVTSQQDEIGRSIIRIEKLERILASQSDSGIKDISQEIPPPHY